MHVDLEESRRCRSTDIMYHPDTLMISRGTDLLTLLMIYYLLGKMKPTSHSKIFISSNFVDMSNVIHHTIYSSVENGRVKLTRL